MRWKQLGVIQGSVLLVFAYLSPIVLTPLPELKFINAVDNLVTSRDIKALEERKNFYFSTLRSFLVGKNLQLSKQ